MGMRWPWQRLAERGIVGMNARNAEFVMGYNRRRLYPLVDDKLQTKRLAEAAGIAVPELYGTVEVQHDVDNFAKLVDRHPAFVVKPAHGAGGDGIEVITGRRGGNYLRANGSVASADDIAHHISNILSGMFSLGGAPDTAMLEYCVQFDPIFERVAFQGVPDIRMIVFRGIPSAAMVRLPTRESGGKANLHQGAVGAGVDMLSGVTRGGVWHNSPVDLHPDTHEPLGGIQIPDWPKLLELGARCFDLVGLGYLGVDIVLDREHGPLVLELNARPGLSIQLANGRGMKPLLDRIVAMNDIPAGAEARVELALTLQNTAG